MRLIDMLSPILSSKETDLTGWLTYRVDLNKK
ncbi:hypothetical protein SAMN06269250_3668 [Spirosoma fluviale]|uniref:Uncharacterized protein n=1 Tax=Spirosoma fluviale TaxID=1597977 RepID=A0A286G8H6_9BACT|nr:hypothetical protein SAMN06269250_3668 [Spirosoma fluviale]